MTRTTFFTVGYEFVTQAEMIAGLVEHGVKRVIDTRSEERRVGKCSVV